MDVVRFNFGSLLQGQTKEAMVAEWQHSRLPPLRQFTVQNPSELYVLVSWALPTTRRDMTCTMLKMT